ncbi:hypothetical protein Agabi119p4_7229 [Agaricus bisporus var. burnettii]|uniref:Uncharacterized protein n=1 Tax=Agaricus bisporus var. burnettii TaxID=192524 RepID=A0A8H7C7Q3_AGABI|nr:hypothetical protein Agabi119p4_7229 [Agaricus bisporus var. burnettii]
MSSLYILFIVSGFVLFQLSNGVPIDNPTSSQGMSFYLDISKLFDLQVLFDLGVFIAILLYTVKHWGNIKARISSLLPQFPIVSASMGWRCITAMRDSDHVMESREGDEEATSGEA